MLTAMLKTSVRAVSIPVRRFMTESSSISLRIFAVSLPSILETIAPRRNVSAARSILFVSVETADNTSCKNGVSISAISYLGMHSNINFIGGKGFIGIAGSFINDRKRGQDKGA